MGADLLDNISNIGKKKYQWNCLLFHLSVILPTGFFTYQCVVHHLNFGRNVWKCVWSVFRSNQTLESGAGELAKVVKSFVRGSVRCTSDKPRLTTSDNNQEGSMKAVAWRLQLILYSLHMKEGGFRKKIQSCCGIPTDQQIFGRVWFPKAFPTRTFRSFSQQSKKSANFMILFTDPHEHNHWHNHQPFPLW